MLVLNFSKVDMEQRESEQEEPNSTQKHLKPPRNPILKHSYLPLPMHNQVRYRPELHKKSNQNRWNLGLTKEEDLFPKKYKMLRTYFFIESGEISFCLSQKNFNFCLKKNYKFSLKELLFFEDPFLKLQIKTEELQIIAIPFSILNRIIEKQFKKWLHKNIGLYLLTSHPFFGRLNRYTLIQFASQFEFKSFTKNQWKDNILYRDSNEKNSFQNGDSFENLIPGASTEFRLRARSRNTDNPTAQEVQTELVFVLKGSLQSIPRTEAQMRATMMNISQIKFSKIVNSRRKTTETIRQFGSLNNDKVISHGKLIKTGIKIRGKVVVSEYPTIIGRINLYKAARMLNEELEYLHELENKKFLTQGSFFQQRLPRFKDFHQLCTLGFDYLGKEVLIWKPGFDMTHVYFCRIISKEKVLRLGFENQILVMFKLSVCNLY